MAVLVILLSFIVFTALNKFLEFGYIPPPRSYTGPYRSPKWRCSMVSLVNSVIAAISSSVSMPALWPDFVWNYTTFGETSLAVIAGYTLYDCVALLRYQQLNRLSGILFHHFIGGFFTLCMLYYQTNLGYGVFCATVEINSIFLHVRMLLLMYEYSKQSWLFRMNNILYNATFLLHRIPVFIMILYTVYVDQGRMTDLWTTSLAIGTSGLIFISTYFFKIIIATDMKGGQTPW